MQDVLRWLHDRGLSHFWEPLHDIGVRTLEDLALVTEADLAECGLRPIQRRASEGLRTRTDGAAGDAILRELVTRIAVLHFSTRMQPPMFAGAVFSGRCRARLLVQNMRRAEARGRRRQAPLQQRGSSHPAKLRPRSHPRRLASSRLSSCSFRSSSASSACLGVRLICLATWWLTWGAWQQS